jgi:hypothetical protein
VLCDRSKSTSLALSASADWTSDDESCHVSICFSVPRLRDAAVKVVQLRQPALQVVCGVVEVLRLTNELLERVKLL